MKYKIHITAEEGELLNTIEIDTDEKNWDSVNSKINTQHEIYDEIYRDMRRKETETCPDCGAPAPKWAAECRVCGCTWD